MKLLLACMFMLAVTYVSAEKIKCYKCLEGDLGGITIEPPDLEWPTEKCNDDDITNSTLSGEIDSEEKECTKIDVTVTVGDKDYTYVVRSVAKKDACDDIVDYLDKFLDKPVQGIKVEDPDVECNQCDEDKCNSAGSLQISLVLLLSSLMAYFMRS